MQAETYFRVAREGTSEAAWEGEVRGGRRISTMWKLEKTAVFIKLAALLPF